MGYGADIGLRTDFVSFLLHSSWSNQEEEKKVAQDVLNQM